MQFTVEITGLDKLMHYLGGNAIQNALTPVLKASQQRIVERLQEYPPELPGQQYVRTYKLHDGWIAQDTSATKTDVSFEIKNDVEYAPYVQSEEKQAAIHQGRWQTEQQVVDEEADNIEANAAQALKDIFTGRLGSYAQPRSK